MAAVGVDRQPAAERQRAVLDEGAGLAAPAEAQALQAEQHGRARNCRSTSARRHRRWVTPAISIGLLARGADRRIPEIHVEIGDRGRTEGLPRAEAGDQHRRLGEVLRSFLRGQDQADGAVVDQAVIQQPQRRDDEAGALMILDA